MTADLPEKDHLKKEEATLVNVVYRSPSSPWGISRFKRPDGTLFEATGEFGKSVLFEDFVMYGQRVPDIEGGDFQVSHFTSTPPRSLNAISGYLTELTGAARSSTVKLVEHFGEATIDVLERTPLLIADSGIPVRDVEKLQAGWKALRSDRLALAQIEIKGIPLYKLSKLERYYGKDVDLNQVIKSDPYCLYIFFDDLPFANAVALANQLGVPNTTECAVRGAVIASLRREAWLGHSLIEGAQLGQLVIKMLRVTPDVVRPLLAPAVAELRRLGLIHVEGRRVQLKQLHEAEQSLFAGLAEWTKIQEQDLELDLVPSEQMGLKMLRPMKIGQALSNRLYTGISSLLSECFAIVQCQCYEDQLFVAKALSLIFKAYEANAVVMTYTHEMEQEAGRQLSKLIPVMTYAELIGIDVVTGIPLQRSANPINADVIVVLGADALGVEEMRHLIDAAPKTGRLYLLGCPHDLPSLSVGQPFADLIDSNQFKNFHSRFWGIPENAKHIAQESSWAGEMTPNSEAFDPTQPVSWLSCNPDDLPELIPALVNEMATALSINPLMNIRVVAPSTASKTVKLVQESLTSVFAEQGLPRSFQQRAYPIGIPVVIRQPLVGTDSPAFSVYTPTDVTNTTMSLVGVSGVEATVNTDDRLDVFDALVMQPKFLRGRRYEVVVLLALPNQSESINRELMSSLINAASRSLVVIGDLDSLADGYAERPSSRTRSQLLDWVSEK